MGSRRFSGIIVDEVRTLSLYINNVLFDGSAGIGGSGTVNTIAKWSAVDTLADSSITDNGTLVTIAAFVSNTKKGDSTFYGTGAGYNSNDNIRCVGIGYNALRDLTSGVQNIAIGMEALLQVTNGVSNIAIGAYALRQNIGNNNNVAIGAHSLRSVNSNFNIGIGSYSLYNLIYGGGCNVAIGYAAGQYYGASNSVTTATECIYIGHNVKASADSITNEIAIGANSVGGGTNTMTLGNANQTKIIMNGKLQIGGSTTAEQVNITGNIKFTSGGLKDNYFHEFTLFDDQNGVNNGDTIMFNTIIYRSDESSDRMNASTYTFSVLAHEVWMFNATIQCDSDGIVELVLWDDTNGVAIAATELDMTSIRYAGVSLNYLVAPSVKTIYKWKIHFAGSSCNICKATMTNSIIGTIFRAKRIVVYN